MARFFNRNVIIRGKLKTEHRADPEPDLELDNGMKVYSGEAETRAAVRAQVGDDAPKGSLYVGKGAEATTKPHLFVKVLNVPGDTDWERVVTQASD